MIITVSVFNDEFNKDIISTNMGSKDEMRSYLALMARNKPTDKALSIVPIWENLPHNKKIYDFLITEAEKNYRNELKFTLPVTYDVSKYPSTDGLQAVSEIW